MPYLNHKPKSLESAANKIQENEYEKVFRKALKKYNKLSSQNKFFLWILGFVYTFVVMFFTIIGTYVICG